MIRCSTVASHGRWHYRSTVVAAARLELCPRPLSAPAYPTSGHAYFSTSNAVIARYDQHNSPIIVQQTKRMTSSNTTDSPFAEHLKKESDNSLDNQQQQANAYNGVSNFTRMLQYQDAPPSKSKERNRRRWAKERDFRQHLERVKSEDGAAETTRPQQQDGTDNNNQGPMSRERPLWRSGNRVKRGNMGRAPNRSNTNTRAEPKPKVTTSEWIKVSNTPPMSKLSDLFPSLNQIIEYEMQKGIIDLDALGGYVTSNALNEIGALNSLYSTQQIGENSNIPLWVPSSSSDDDVSPMILEARIHLSFRARPVGWFLRLPNRSVAHAVLNHARRAEIEQQQKWRVQDETGSLKQQSKQWREGLWRGVYAEYNEGGDGKKQEASRVSLEDESHDEKELMWGDGLEEDDEDAISLESADAVEEEDVTAHTLLDELHDDKKKPIDVDDYLEKYTQSHPYPTQSTKPSTNLTPEYQLLKCGSTSVNIQEFSPYSSDFASRSDQNPPWEQHSFQMSPLLNLSDSVVRVETSYLRTSEEDIRYLFRGHDLEAVMPEAPEDPTTSTDAPPSNFTDLPRSLGWNTKSKGNVDFLVEGKSEPQRISYNIGKKEVNPIGSRRHTFLVRFATPADARMAVRDKEGKLLGGRSLSIAQYPQQ